MRFNEDSRVINSLIETRRKGKVKEQGKLKEEGEGDDSKFGIERGGKVLERQWEAGLVPNYFAPYKHLTEIKNF